MDYRIIHELPRRIRIDCGRALSPGGAAALASFLLGLEGVETVQASSLTGRLLITLDPPAKGGVLDKLGRLELSALPVSSQAPYGDTEEEFQNKLFSLVTRRIFTRFFLPPSLGLLYTGFQALGFIGKGLKALARGALTVEVLDAAAVSVSLAQGQSVTAGSIMFMLGLGEVLEDYTHKRSRAALADSFSLNIDTVWRRKDGEDQEVPIGSIRPGDLILVRSGAMIPLDGEVFEGEALVCQASLTGEPLPVLKRGGNAVYAGTVVEEGELVITASTLADETRIGKIISIIDESEGLKAKIQGRAERLADSIVPFSFAGAAITLGLTGRLSKAIAFLMVDYSCAIKLAMPIAVLSAMGESARRRILVKGGKFLEAAALADTVIFDKTGTLTEARPVIVKVVPTEGQSRREVLSMAACLEDHFPHSVAEAVVRQADQENLKHREEHSKLEYVVAHGVAACYAESRVVLGSYHFVFEDEKTLLTETEKELIERETEGYSAIYLAKEGRLLGIIAFTDPPRRDASSVIGELKSLGISRIVMITGDNRAAAGKIAGELGITEYYAEVLPQDKSRLVKEYKARGSTVIMVGDGINDAPALAASDAGIAMINGCDLAREAADVVLLSSNLGSLCHIIRIGRGLLSRISGNYRKILLVNSSLLALSLGGIISPGTSALLHNLSTFLLSSASSRPYLPDYMGELNQER
ncbi:MAG: heavy metal translocating P-type ATPase [Spirochaetales bacterium]|jgi:heavy metal translocating P-type ATPase|nr:heavy metal translocating P-type ATPase [Spirochaetales bacterium]